jgi:hypothetical protein
MCNTIPGANAVYCRFDLILDMEIYSFEFENAKHPLFHQNAPAFSKLSLFA